MLLNDFLYQRSLLKTEQHQRRLKFNTLVPQTSIFDGVENPFEKEEYIEEIKTVIVKGGTKGEALEEKEKELEEKEKELEEKELEEKEKELEEKELEEKEKEKEKELEEKEKELEEKEKELEEEEKELELEEEEKEEWISVDDEGESTSESLKKIKKAVAYLATKDGGKVDDSFEHKDVIFDNLSKKGGTADDKDIKNVVVSFF
jgi:DNA repair exonuclease SbcCD ATPase subunit